MTRMGSAIAAPFALLFGWHAAASAQTMLACAVASPPTNCADLWATQVEVRVPPGTGGLASDPGCTAESQEDVLRIIRAARATRAIGRDRATQAPSADEPMTIDQYAGPLTAAVATQITEALSRRGTRLDRVFEPFVRERVACATVAAVIPVRSFYMGHRVLAAEDIAQPAFQPCIPGQDCPLGSAIYPMDPVQQRNGEINLISTTFVNRSPDQARRARLIVFYRMIAGEEPRTGEGASAAAAPAASASAPTRKVPFEGASNFRDLGGYTTSDGRGVRWRMLYRSDALDSLTPSDWRTLETLRIHRITDFRADREIEQRPDRLPATLESRRHWLPLDYRPTGAAGAAGVLASQPASKPQNDAELLAGIDRSLMAVYARFAREKHGEHGAWLRSLLEGPPDGAHVFHDTGGADRVGYAAALILMTLGVSRDQVIEDYALTNQYLYSPEGRALLAKRLAGRQPPGVAAHARYLEASLDTIVNDYGSFDAYLRDVLKIDDATRQELQKKFLE